MHDAGTLDLHPLGFIRATPTFRRVIISATLGIALFYLLTMVLGIFGVTMPFLGAATRSGSGSVS